jgi:glycerate 2-kinase
MVRILVAPDKFKGSLSAAEVCQSVVEGLSNDKKYLVTSLPLADGGEGTFEILLSHFKGRTISIDVHDPLMRKIKASYGISNDGTTAFIEMAKASGLQLLKPEERNPLYTTTYGTGELIADALYKGVTKIVLGIGGSATNDGGVGMASALGFTFLNNKNFFNPVGGKDLKKITSIDRSIIHSSLLQTEFITLCDVKNPLTGKDGAAHVYAAQKGASPADIKVLEENMIYFNELLKAQFNFSGDFEGAGAAGGVGAGAKFFLNTKIVSGMEYISQATSLKEHIKTSDIIITGEGKLDSQSLSGKVVDHVTRLAKSQGKKVIVLCGVNSLNETEMKHLAVDECLELTKDGDTATAIKNASSLIKQRLAESKILRNL